MAECISKEAVRELLLSYSPTDDGDLSDEEQACLFMLTDILTDLDDIEIEYCPNCGVKLDGVTEC